MKKLVIFILIFSLMSFFVHANELDLQVSVNNKEVTLTWNNILKEDVSPATSNSRNINEDSKPLENDLKAASINDQNDEVPVIPINPPITPPENNENQNNGISAVTTEAVLNNKGFFSKIYFGILKAFRNIFGLKPVGVSINQYIIYKYKDSSSVTGDVLHQGSLEEFNCQETCSYTYTENNYGTYTYSVSSKGGIEKESARTSVIEIKEPELKCDSLSNCPQGFICSSNRICAVKQEDEKKCGECPTLTPLPTNFCEGGLIIQGEADECGCSNPPKCQKSTCISDSECKLEEKCDLTTKSCVLKSIEKECDENKPCTDTNKKCDLTINKCAEKIPVETIKCDEFKKCGEGTECVNGACALKTINPPTIQNNTNQTNPGNNTNSTICVNGAEESQVCNFDIGICQKQGQEKRICQNNAFGDFRQCEPVEKCNTGNECESGICDIDFHSCLPAEFEDGEESCEDNLDNDCDSFVDCKDEDCGCLVPSPDQNGNQSNLSSPSSSVSSQSQSQSNFRDLNLGESYQQNENINDFISNNRYETQDSQGSNSMITWIIVFVILLIFGGTAIYLYLFKFRKYNKKDIIIWVEHCREMISQEKSLEDAIKEMNNYNLPKDFVKIVMKKLR